MLAKTLGQRPSTLLGYWIDAWVSYQLDSAVLMVGIAIENALNEMINVGDEKEPHYESRYTLDQLLDEHFRLPSPAEVNAPDFSALKGVHGIVTD